MTTKVINIKDLKVNKVQFSKPKVNKSGGKAIYINYDYEDGQGPKPLRIQMPKMKVPFGISGYDQDNSDNLDNSVTDKSKDSIVLSLGQHEVAIEKLKQLDKMFLDRVKANPIEFFNKKKSEEVIDDSFTASVKYAKNKVTGEISTEYPPTMKNKLYKDNEGKYNLQVYTPDRKPVEMTIYNHNEIMPKGCECVTLLGVAGWVTTAGLGLSWRPAQMIVYKADNTLQNFAFLEDPDIEITTEVVIKATEELSVKSEPVEESETEEPETQEEAVEEEPEPEEEDPLEEIVETKPKATRGRSKK